MLPLSALRGAVLSACSSLSGALPALSGAGTRGILTTLHKPGDGKPQTVTLIPGDGIGEEGRWGAQQSREPFAARKAATSEHIQAAFAMLKQACSTGEAKLSVCA